MSDKLRDCLGRLEDIIYKIEDRQGTPAYKDIALLVSKSEADEITDMISSGMSAWEVRQLKNSYTNLKYKDYRLLVI